MFLDCFFILRNSVLINDVQTMDHGLSTQSSNVTSKTQRCFVKGGLKYNEVLKLDIWNLIS